MRKVNRALIMHKYFLFIFGKIDSITKEFLKDIIMDINENQESKFYTLNGGIVFHFSSVYSYEEISKTIKIAVKDQKISDTYFLIQSTDNLSVELPNFNVEEFLNLKTINVDAIDIELEESDYHLHRLFEYLDSNDDDDDDDEFISILRPNNESVLNFILDKIKEKGINSLTKEEEKYLKQYN